MRKWMAGLLAVMLVSGVSVGVSASPTDGQGHRIVLTSTSASRARLVVRHKLGNGRVSADVTDAQLASLERQGISYERVPERWVVARPTKGKPGGGGSRPLPSTQVPYGIKMIYGDPILAPAGISGGAGITVAILDTGSINHVDFTRADGTKVITGCVDFSQKKSNQVEGVCADGNGHGTHVTGTVAAAGGLDGMGVFGVAPQASVFSYKVLNNQGRGYADDVARAIRVAADRGAKIISMSLGSSSPSIDEQEAIQYAASKGALVVAAAGNSGPDAGTIGYPGGFAEAVAVAALNPDEAVSYFSSRGITDGNDGTIAEREVEVAAPGRSTISTYKDGGYTTMSGTSMATPHIAGLAAKMWQGSATRTRDWLRQAAQNHDIIAAEQINNAGPGYDIAGGYGLPQVNTLSQPMWNN
ncbi:MAG TPA: S8 family serine peptidase [Symbiobacteriaceae bacterium]|nr:S8 family serine peptidase [Symbiobacteriaceae bacterium]